MHAAIDEGNKFRARKLLHQLNMATWANTYNKSEDVTGCTVPTHSLKKESGQPSFVAYGHRVKAVQVSRGGKKGNNAFVGDDEDSAVKAQMRSFSHHLENVVTRSKFPDLLNEFTLAIDPTRTSYTNAIQSMTASADVGNAKPALQRQPSHQMVQLNRAMENASGAASSVNALTSTAASNSAALKQLTSSTLVFDVHTREDKVYNYLTTSGLQLAALAGNLPMVRCAFAIIQRRSHLAVAGSSAFTSTSHGITYVAGFNAVHAETIKASAPGVACGGFTEASKIKAISATKKAQGNESITPVHLAAIMPDTSRLEALFKILGPSLLQVTDAQQRTPVFYAAASSTTAALEWLITKGANIFAVDARMKTPLDYAVVLLIIFRCWCRKYRIRRCRVMLRQRSLRRCYHPSQFRLPPHLNRLQRRSNQ